MIPDAVGVEIPDVQYWRRNIPCQDACPVHTDARGYVRAVAEGDFERAYLIARGPNPLASMCGRVCGAPCEASCRRGQVDRPIAIRALKRFVSEQHAPQASTEIAKAVQAFQTQQDCESIDTSRHLLARFKDVPLGKPVGERVAIIGSGPAGLAAAHDLCLMGLQPVIFEMEDVPAGMLHVGVPEYRLPRDVIRAEVEVIEALGTEIRCGVEVGEDITLSEIISEFKAVIIAVGAKKSRLLPLPGAEGPGLLGGIEFLRDVSYGRPIELGERVVVIGGGNVAYDAARTVVRHTYVDISRTAKRLQAVKEVYLVCLESLAEMPADDLEIEEGDEEGVVRLNGWGPTEILRDGDGKITGVQFQRCSRAFDEDGLFSPVFDSEDRKIVECDSVVVTIGQAVELSFIDQERDGIRLTERGLIETDREALATSRDGVFVAGDVALGMGLMIDAIASGKKVARNVYQYLTGEQATPEMTDFHRVLANYSREYGFETVQRVTMPATPVEQRVKSQDIAVELGYDEQRARLEASRCLDCGVNTIFDGTKCILCGGCVDVCPMLCLKLVPASQLTGQADLPAIASQTADGEAWREGSAIIKDESKCIRCANCADRCPNGAITMERFCFKEQVV